MSLRVKAESFPGLRGHTVPVPMLLWPPLHLHCQALTHPTSAPQGPLLFLRHQVYVKVFPLAGSSAWKDFSHMFAWPTSLPPFLKSYLLWAQPGHLFNAPSAQSPHTSIPDPSDLALISILPGAFNVFL